jgi:serine/threonine protein kinase
MDGEGNIKINDFGLSNIMKLGLFLETSCGSPLYSPPEIISGASYIGPEVDIWAMGVIIFAMVCGYLPWEGRDVNEQIEHVVRGNYKTASWVSECMFFLNSHLLLACKNLMSRMIVVDSKKRATLAEVRNHPWLQTYNPGTTPLVAESAPTTGNLATPQATRGIKKFTPDLIDEGNCESSYLTALEIVQKLQQLGYDPAEVIKNLSENNTLSQSYFLYTLMLREKVKQKEQQLKSDHLEKPPSPQVGGPPKSPRPASLTRPMTPDVKSPESIVSPVERFQVQTRARRHTWGGLEDAVGIPPITPGKLPIPDSGLPPVSSPKEPPKSGRRGSIFNILRKKKKQEVDEVLATEFQNGLVLRAVHKNRKSAEDVVAEVISALKRLKIVFEEVQNLQTQC